MRTGHAERLKAVAEASGPAGGGPAVPADVNRKSFARNRFGIAHGVVEVEELAVVRRSSGRSAHSARRTASCSSVRLAPAVERDAARFDFFLEPAHAHAQPKSAAREHINGGGTFGEHDGMVVGQNQHPGGQPEPGGAAGQERQHVERVGDRAVRGQPDPSGTVVRIDTVVAGGQDGVLHDDDGFEAAVLEVTCEGGHPVRVGGDTVGDRDDDPELQRDLMAPEANRYAWGPAGRSEPARPRPGWPPCGL